MVVLVEKMKMLLSTTEIHAPSKIMKASLMLKLYSAFMTLIDVCGFFVITRYSTYVLLVIAHYSG